MLNNCRVRSKGSKDPGRLGEDKKEAQHLTNNQKKEKREEE